MYYCYPAFDNAGNMYVAQASSNTIRKIDAAGIISTIAGQLNVLGYSGDGGLAINALLHHPNSMFTDNAGNLFLQTGVYGTKITSVEDSVYRFSHTKGSVFSPEKLPFFNCIFNIISCRKSLQFFCFYPLI